MSARVAYWPQLEGLLSPKRSAGVIVGNSLIGNTIARLLGLQDAEL